MASLSRSIAGFLGIRQGEFAKTAGMFAYLLMAVGCFITGRITRDALFLSRFDVSYLPYMYAWTALAMTVLCYTYSRFADRGRRDRLVLAVTTLLLLGVLLARLLLITKAEWFYPVLYVFVEVMGGLLTIQFWTFAQDVFDTREAKRLFGIVGAGGVIAAILAGFLTGALAQAVGTENLLFLCAGLLLGCLGIVLYLSRLCRRELTQAMAGRQPGREAISLSLDLGKIFSSRHLKFIAWITILTFATITLVDYQFKIVARYTHLNREDQLSGFFGMFYGITGVLSVFIQLLVTGRLLQRFGIVVALLLVPISLAGGSVLFLTLPALWSVTALKGADNVLRYTVNDASTQILYLPVPGKIRGRARAFIDGILKPAAEGLAGLAIAWLVPLFAEHVQWLALATLLFLAAWLGLVLLLKKEYLSSLISTLRQRKVHFGESTLSLTDSQTVEALQQTLSDPSENNVLHALEMVPFVRRHDWSGELGRLLDHPSAKIRQEAIRLLAPEGALAFQQRILQRFDDPDESVRAEAVSAYCLMLKERAMDAVEPLLKDESVHVRASAVVGLMRYGGLDGIVAAADSLKAMLASPDPEYRKSGSWSVGQVGVKTFYRSLLPLLEDPSPPVRVEAVEAAGVLRSVELVLPLIQRLSDRQTERAAIVALAGYGPSLLTTLRTVLNNPRENPAILRAIPQVLALVGDQLSMDILGNVLQTEDLVLRGRALEALLQLQLRFPSLRRDREMLRRVLHQELKEAYQLLTTAVEVEPLSATLLDDNLQHLQRQTLERIFTLLRVLFPGRNLDAAIRNLGNPAPAPHANALELLDNMLDSETRRCLLPLLEDRDRKHLVAKGSELFPLLHRDPNGWLHELVVSRHEWTAACALDVVRRQRLPGFEAVATNLLSHKAAQVREAAAFCLKELSTPEKFASAMQRLCDDPHPLLRSLAQALAGSCPAE